MIKITIIMITLKLLLTLDILVSLSPEVLWIYDRIRQGNNGETLYICILGCTGYKCAVPESGPDCLL